MKGIFAFFLAVYVLSLTLEPCVDKEIHLTGSHVACAAESDHGAAADHKNLCSPFCTCSCCNIFMEVAAALILPATPVLHNTFCYFYDPQLTSIFLPAIWDPPKDQV
jgi:hypothetical protein